MSSSFLHFSSITQKIWMALLGLFLMVFLVVHLGINLCLLRNDGGLWFHEAAHFMGANYIVKVFEVALFGVSSSTSSWGSSCRSKTGYPALCVTRSATNQPPRS